MLIFSSQPQIFCISFMEGRERGKVLHFPTLSVSNNRLTDDLDFLSLEEGEQETVKLLIDA